MGVPAPLRFLIHLYRSRGYETSMTLLCDGYGLKGPGRCGQGPTV
jgi:hypothetical protein